MGRGVLRRGSHFIHPFLERLGIISEDFNIALIISTGSDLCTSKIACNELLDDHFELGTVGSLWLGSILLIKVSEMFD